MKSTKSAAAAQAKLDAVVNLIAVQDDGKLLAIEDRRTTAPVEVQIVPTKLTAAEKRKAASMKRVAADTAKQIAANKLTPAQAKVMGEALDVSPEDATANVEVITGYNGPMRALRDRVKAGKYTKAANGQPSCGDDVATALGTLEPTEVIAACMVAMDIANPYLNLNIGQQSMNLRNKLRGQLKRGEIGMGVLREAIEVILEGRPAKADAPTRIKLTSATGIDTAAEQHPTEASAELRPAAPGPTKGRAKRAPKAAK